MAENAKMAPEAGARGGPGTRGRPALSGLFGHLRRAGAATVALAVPPSCLCCHRLVEADQALCAACWTQIPFLAPPWCARLGLPFAYDLGPEALSPLAIARPPRFDRLRAACAYSGPVRALVTGLKYGDRPALAEAMGRWMARAGAELLSEGSKDAPPETGPPLLVPVPLHPLRQWARRYNQSMRLAQAVAGASGCELAPDLLRRIRRTRRQVGLDRVSRASNVRGAFALAPEAAMRLAGRRAVLIDDVYTTGATVSAATRVLRAAGAVAVDVLVFAHAGADTPLQ